MARLDRRLGVLIATALMLLVTFFLVVLPPSYHVPFVSSAFIVLLALPAFGVAIKQDVKKGLLAVFVVGIFSLLIESIGILTGFPYSFFVYGESIGTKLGVVPWTVFFAWPPLVFGVWAFTKKLWSKKALLLAPLLLVAVDLVLDPVNAALGFWVWATPGMYYGVPLVNFAGWLFSGTIGVLLLCLFFPKGLPIGALYSVFLILLFATCASLWMGFWIPFLIGLGYLVFLYYETLPKNLRHGLQAKSP